MSLIAVITFVRTYWKLAALGVLALLLAIQTVRLGHAGNEIERREIDIRELRAAAVEAERLNRAQVQRIELEQQEITDEVSRDLSARLERLRSELRAKAAQGNSTGPQAGPDGKAPSGIAEEARLCLTSSQLLQAAENEERHDQLITWVNEQLKIER